MTTSEYIYTMAMEAQIKQKLASLAGLGNLNLSDYTIYQLIKEVERAEQDYIKHGAYVELHPTVQEAFLFLHNIEQRN